MSPGSATRKAWPALFTGLCLFFTTSCQEAKRLDNEILAAKTELDQVQVERSDIQRELDRMQQQLQAAASTRLTPDGDQPPAEKELPKLMERKSSLEAEIASLRKEMDEYKAKYR